MEDLHDAVYDVVFDHLKSFEKEELERLGLYKYKPSDHDELYGPFQFITDRIIRAKGIGEHNSLQARNAIRDELAQIDKVIAILQIASIDDLSERLLTVTAVNQQYGISAITKLSNVLGRLSTLIRDEELGRTLRPVLAARRDELAFQHAQYGRSNVVPNFVAEECRVIWFQTTRDIAANTFKNLDQHFPLFVDDVFSVLFADEQNKPSVRTALQKSASRAALRIEALRDLDVDGTWEISSFDEHSLTDGSKN